MISRSPSSRGSEDTRTRMMGKSMDELSNGASCSRPVFGRVVTHAASTRRSTSRVTWAAAVALMLGAVGCGSDLNQVLFETVAAAGRTFVDQVLTDVANTLADREDDADGTPSDGDQDGDDVDGGDGDGDGDGNGDGEPPDGGFDEHIGDPVAGEALYTANTCAVCHCADGAGGCLPGAPPLTGVSAEVLDELLRGDAPHASKVDLTNQEIVDLEAYLASL